MPVWIPWLKVTGEGKGEKGGGKGWTPTWNKGGGKGWGKDGDDEGGLYRERKPPQSVPEDFEVNTETRYTGTVRSYRKFSGFGFVELTEKGVVPADNVYVHWKSIQTEDRYPQLMVGQEIEFNITKVRDKPSGTWTLKAKNVTQPGGALVAVQDELDSQSKQFVGGQHLRYTGQLQFFSPQRGFGWVTMDDGYALTEPVPKELRIDLPEVNAAGKQPPYVREIAVEFGIVKGRRGGYKAYNMTLPGGIPMTQEGLEHRVVLGDNTFQGTVEMFNWQKGYGFIKGSAGSAFPPNVVAKMKQHLDDAQQRGKSTSMGEQMLYFRKEDIKDGYEVDTGTTVTFKVYTDDKGAGACDIHF